MSKTPYSDLTTQDILSAHISGLAHSINKMEDALNMGTTSSSFTLWPVVDQREISLRYRIYEGAHRNWLSFSLKRNGVIVPSDEYEAQPSFGVIVFNSPQTQTDIITVEATYISNKSKKIESIESDISNLVKVDKGHTASIQTIESKIQTLEGSDAGISLEDLGLFSLRNPEVVSNVRPQFGGDPGKVDGNSITMGSLSIDSFPVIITKTTTISKMSITFSADSTSANNLLGIYSNDESKTAPNKLIASTAIFRYENTVQETKDIPLTSPITLEPGIYWMARWSNDGVRLEGHITYPEKFIMIIPPHGLYESSRKGQNNGTSYAIGVRTSSIGNVTSLPATFPTLNGTSAFYLIRGSQGTIKLLV